MAITEFIVDGMSCQHCVKTVTNALRTIPGVKEAKVDLQQKTAQVEYDETLVDLDVMFEAVKQADFTPQKKNR